MKIKLPKPRKPKYAEILVAWTILSFVGLFGAQYWFETWSEATVYAGEMPANGEAVAEMMAAQSAALEGGTLSIEEAMQRVASADRTSIPLIAPEASADMAPAAGWMHMPGYEAPPVFDPAAMSPETPEEIVPTEDEEAETDEEVPAETPTDAPEPDARPTMRAEIAPTPGGAAMGAPMAAPMAAAPAVMMNAAAAAPAAMMNAAVAAPAAAQDTE